MDSSINKQKFNFDDKVSLQIHVCMHFISVPKRPTALQSQWKTVFIYIYCKYGLTNSFNKEIICNPQVKSKLLKEVTSNLKARSLALVS